MKNDRCLNTWQKAWCIICIIYNLLALFCVCIMVFFGERPGVLAATLGMLVISVELFFLTMLISGLTSLVTLIGFIKLLSEGSSIAAKVLLVIFGLSVLLSMIIGSFADAIMMGIVALVHFLTFKNFFAVKE